MFSTRCLAILALAVAASALPAQEKPLPQPITSITNDEIAPPVPGPWFNVPFFGDITKIFAPLWKLFPTFEELGPQIVANDNKFQVIVQVKDYKKSDLKVKVKGDFIFVQGSHDAKLQDDHDLFASQFFHTYTLPANSSASSVTAELTTDGYLVIDAPIGGPVDQSKVIDREIPIVSIGTPYKKVETPQEVTPEVLTPEVVKEEVVTPEVEAVEPALPEEDRKEPTTISPEREEVTEKDNVIPHGNEINEVSPLSDI